jgi:hypothetical protein
MHVESSIKYGISDVLYSEVVATDRVASIVGHTQNQVEVAKTHADPVPDPD